MSVYTLVDTKASFLYTEFFDRLVSLDDQAITERSARQIQRMDNGIEEQRKVLAVSASEWTRTHQVLHEKRVLTPKEVDLIKVAMQIPNKLPTEKQSLVLLEILDKGLLEGVRTEP